ncbi:MAG TPA: RidA family protein [Vicinamibacterales bacterium]|jgi:enamine deaminase RidA (YjgF/YER057c/UK114 family)
MSAERQIRELNLTLPDLPPPAANYVHAVRTGNLLFLAGKGLPEIVGKVGAEVSTTQAYDIARQVGLLLLAVMRYELGSLDRVVRVVKVLGLVNATPEFRNHPEVINGCSDLFVQVFGERGRHARTSVGAGSLPFQIPVEIEAVVEVKD